MKNTIRILITSMIFFISLKADDNLKYNIPSQILQVENKAKISDLKQKIENIDLEIKDNVWIIKFANFLNYHKLTSELNELQNELKKVKNKWSHYSFSGYYQCIICCFI